MAPPLRTGRRLADGNAKRGFQLEQQSNAKWSREIERTRQELESEHISFAVDITS